MIVRDQALVLRFAPCTNTSRFVTWLTREHGKVVTLIRGSQRPKSFFLGQFDLFYSCDLVFYAREVRNVHSARECWPEQRRDHLRRDWRACAAASYCADVTARALPFDSPAPGFLELLERTLDALRAEGRAAAVMHWFELRLLDELGLRPRLQACLACGRTWDQAGRRARFSPGRGGLLCASCAGPGEEDAEPVAPDTLALLGVWQRAEAPEELFPTRVTPRQANELQRVLGRLLRYHLALPLPSRDLALEALAKPNARH